MIFFLILLMPVSLFVYYAVYPKNKFLTLTFAGLFFSLLVCAIRFIFFYSHRLVPDNFLENFIYYFIRMIVIPFVLYGAFCLVSKDTGDFKIKAFFPFIGGFTCVFYPYFFLAMSNSVYSGYDLFFRPVLYLAMLISFSLFLKKIYLAHKKENSKLKYILLSVLFTLFPVVVDTMYFMNKFFFIFALLGVIYIACVSINAVLDYKRSN